jgi:drug/metabolite transporter (DMT)-like permease
MVISGIIMGGFSSINGTAIQISEIPWQAWGAIIYLAVFGSVISFIAYLFALQHLPTTQASIYAYINPIIAVLSGFLMYGDPLTLYLAAGGAVILYGVYLVNNVYSKSQVG